MEKKKFIIGGIAIIIFLLIATNTIHAVPALKLMTLNPVTPKPQDEVTFTADISGDYADNAEMVYLIVEECKAGFCYSDGFNISMSDDDSDDIYDAKINLKHDDATEIKYYVNFKVQGHPTIEWTQSDTTELNLDTTSSDDNGDNTNGESNDNSDSGGLPGFELIFIIIAIFAMIIIYRKKR